MDDNILIPLPGFKLPRDYPWQIGFVRQVNEQLKSLRCTGHFLPPRFFGYYFQGCVPVGVAGSWTVKLDDTMPLSVLPDLVLECTDSQYGIHSLVRTALPDFMLIHDRLDGTCCLLNYENGLRFVEASEPTTGGPGDEEETKLLGP